MKKKRRMKKKWKPLYASIIIIIIIILILGLNPIYPKCIGSKIDDVRIEISTDTKTLKNNTTKFLIIFKLKNNRPYPVCVECGFSVGDNVRLELVGPAGEINLKYPVTKQAAMKEILIVEKVHKENIAKYYGSYEGNPRGFNWDITGDYTLTAYYLHPFDGYKRTGSNAIEFTIVE